MWRDYCWRHRKNTPDTFHYNRGVFTIHCVCHRLALIVTDAMKGTKAYEPVIYTRGLLAVLNSNPWIFCEKYEKKRNYGNTWKTWTLLSEKTKYRRKPNTDNCSSKSSLTMRSRTYLKVLVEQHKLPRRIVLTRWLPSVEAIKVVATSRAIYQDFFQFETSKKGTDIYEWLTVIHA